MSEEEKYLAAMAEHDKVKRAGMTPEQRTEFKELQHKYVALSAAHRAPQKSHYQAAAEALPDAMRPLRDYCAKQRAKPDLPEYAFKHVQQIEAALEAMVTFYKAAEEIHDRQSETYRLNKFINRIQKHIDQCTTLLEYNPENISEYAESSAPYTHYTSSSNHK